MSQLETTVRFTCPKCNRYVSTPVAVPELDFNAGRSAENTAEGQIEVACPRCSIVFIAECLYSMGSCDMTLTDFPSIRVDCDYPTYSSDDESWVEWKTPSDPKAVFMDSYHLTGELLTEHGGTEGVHLVNRMIFTQQVSALEAYLSDTLVNLVMNDDTAMVKLIKLDRDLANKKFTLHEILSVRYLVKTEVLSHLKRTVYHNIPKVHELYKIAASIDLYALLGPAKEDLFRAVEYRHHCVHRNGRDDAGNLLNVFTKKYVQDVADMACSLVRKIEMSLVPPLSEGLDDDIPW